MSKEQTPITAEEHKSRMHFLDLATKKLSNGVHKTFEETCSYGFSEISKVVYYAMNMYNRQTLNKAGEEKEQYAQAKVLEERNKNKKEFLEALEVEVKDAFIEGQSNNSDSYYDNYYNTAEKYYETQVKPNYE